MGVNSFPKTSLFILPKTSLFSEVIQELNNCWDGRSSLKCRPELSLNCKKVNIQPAIQPGGGLTFHWPILTPITWSSSLLRILKPKPLRAVYSAFSHNRSMLHTQNTARRISWTVTTRSAKNWEVKRAHSSSVHLTEENVASRPSHHRCARTLNMSAAHYTQWSTECDWSCKQLADVVQQFAVCDESPPWSWHLD